jgi:hypothetical protein
VSLEIIISAVGACVTLGLTINAFFLRGIFLDLNAVKVELAKMFERSSAKELRLENLERNEREIFDRLNLLEREVLK